MNTKYADLTTHVEFTWTAGNGLEYPIYEMTTDHVYNTLKMIWNHSVRTDCIIHPFHHKYEFVLKRYTREYILEAIAAMIKEIQFRGDKKAWQSNGVQLMANTSYKFSGRLLK